MDADLRIPVTTEQKQKIVEATRLEPDGMAAWARTVLLQAARQKIKREAAKQHSEEKRQADITSGR